MTTKYENAQEEECIETQYKYHNNNNNKHCSVPLRNKNGVIVEFAIVDELYFDKINKYDWFLHPSGYAATYIHGRLELMDQFIWKLSRRFPMDPSTPLRHKRKRRLSI